jgi:hypothetical protein
MEDLETLRKLKCRVFTEVNVLVYVSFCSLYYRERNLGNSLELIILYFRSMSSGM